VWRINQAPTQHFEELVGSRTHVRVVNHVMADAWNGQQVQRPGTYGSLEPCTTAHFHPFLAQPHPTPHNIHISCTPGTTRHAISNPLLPTGYIQVDNKFRPPQVQSRPRQTDSVFSTRGCGPFTNRARCRRASRLPARPIASPKPTIHAGSCTEHRVLAKRPSDTSCWRLRSRDSLGRVSNFRALSQHMARPPERRAMA
jgi:hypothetical protein